MKSLSAESGKTLAEGITLYEGDSREIIPGLDAEFDAIVTDPPYGAGFTQGDGSPDEAEELLTMVLSLAVPKLTSGAFVVLFSGNQTMDRTMRAAEKAGLRFSRLLTMHVQQGSARPYRGWLTRTQPILVYRAPGRKIPRWRIEPATRLSAALKAKGWNASRLAQELGCGIRLVTKWYRLDDDAWSYPNDEHRAKLRDLLGLDLPSAPETEEPSFRHDCYEVAGFGADTSHPCEKPLWVISDIVTRIADKGDMLLDPFSGSGSTLVAARDCGVRCVGIEVEPRFCRIIRERLRQPSLALV